MATFRKLLTSTAFHFFLLLLVMCKSVGSSQALEQFCSAMGCVAHHFVVL